MLSPIPASKVFVLWSGRGASGQSNQLDAGRQVKLVVLLSTLCCFSHPEPLVSSDLAEPRLERLQLPLKLAAVGSSSCLVGYTAVSYCKSARCFVSNAVKEPLLDD
ncbi:unnamed protein product [Durusdinium trenchii]|uniref:Secreted protein n=1 Tax=Durusdinium trenchii TaxID=1381693 RepID=A0ABP0PW23_9DINO